MYLHCANKLLSKMYITSDMSRFSVEGLNHYTMVCGLYCRRIKDSVVGHQTVQWKTMKDCFRDIHNIDAGYRRAKGNCRVDLKNPEALTSSKVKTTKEPGPCHKCGRPHSKITA